MVRSVSLSWKTAELSPVERARVQQHLEEILASALFSGSKRASLFLRHLVDHALASDFDSLRERMIGADLFGRPINYDTGSDSVVRVKATEVRKKLSQYYADADGAQVTIDIPTGSYIPRFSFAPHEIEGEAAPSTESASDSGGGTKFTTVARRFLRSMYGLIRLWHVALASSILAGGILVAWFLLIRVAVPVHSVAVLPLENLSGVPVQQYMADGLTKEIAAHLAHNMSFHVLPPEVMSSSAGANEPLQSLARRLTTESVLQGSLVRQGNLALISVRLVRVKSNTTLWMHTYVRDFATASAWQGELAQTISRDLNEGISLREWNNPKRNQVLRQVAEDLYSHGHYLLEAEDCVNAAGYFRAAINIDFHYPEAHAALAFCYGHLGETDRIDSRDAFSLQKFEALKAIEMNDSMAEAHAELANAVINLNADWVTAASEFRRALALNPGSASIHEEHQRYLVRVGRTREALAEIQSTEGLAPFSSRIYHLQGELLYDCREYDQALLLMQKVRTLDIAPPNWHYLLGEIYAAKGIYPTSIAEFQMAGTRPQALGHFGYVYAKAGKPQKAADQIERLEEMVKNESIGRYEIALIYAGLGRKNEAFKWLDEAYKARDQGITYLKIDPCLNSLRSDPRFADLLNRVGLVQ